MLKAESLSGLGALIYASQALGLFRTDGASNSINHTEDGLIYTAGTSSDILSPAFDTELI